MLSAKVSKATRSPSAELEEVNAFASTGAPAGPVAREMRTTSSLAASAGAASASGARAGSDERSHLRPSKRAAHLRDAAYGNLRGDGHSLGLCEPNLSRRGRGNLRAPAGAAVRIPG